VNSGPAGLTLVTIGIIAGVFALGTLIYTALALSLAPQVVMFVGLTHTTIGLDHVRPGGDRDPEIARVGRPGFRWLTRPMLLGILVAAICLVAALVTISPGRFELTSVHAELVQPGVVDAEVVGQLMDDRHPHLVGEVVGVRVVRLER
jgi:hypothetical protein